MPFAVFLILLAAALVLTALLRTRSSTGETVPLPTEAPRPPEIPPADAERLEEIIALLGEVMDHRELGGPGYLTVQFPQQLFAGSFPTVTAQYPNIGEGLYRRVVRRELDREALEAAGVPGALFDHNPAFAAEGGGVVVLTAEVYGLTPALEKGMADRRTRGTLLAALARELSGPALSVRVLGQELLVERPRRTAERSGQ